MSETLKVDMTACTAHGMCAELLPERVTLDDWGYPIVDGRPVDGDLLDLARRAVDTCPVMALRLEAARAARTGANRTGAVRRGPRAGAAPRHR